MKCKDGGECGNGGYCENCHARPKERPLLFKAPMVRAILDGIKTQTRRIVKPQPFPESISHGQLFLPPKKLGKYIGEVEHVRPPYGKTGERLWVRETCSFENGVVHADRVTYRADGEWLPPGGHWRPSIHMPRWASRITLEITGVRVERLQDISRGDAMAEGCPFPNMAHGDDPRHWYAGLWEQINGTGSWDANPWVWVIEFKRVLP